MNHSIKETDFTEREKEVLKAVINQHYDVKPIKTFTELEEAILSCQAPDSVMNQYGYQLSMGSKSVMFDPTNHEFIMVRNIDGQRICSSFISLPGDNFRGKDNFFRRPVVKALIWSALLDVGCYSEYFYKHIDSPRIAEYLTFVVDTAYNIDVTFKQSDMYEMITFTKGIVCKTSGTPYYVLHNGNQICSMEISYDTINSMVVKYGSVTRGTINVAKMGTQYHPWLRDIDKCVEGMVRLMLNLYGISVRAHGVHVHEEFDKVVGVHGIIRNSFNLKKLAYGLPKVSIF